jgi:hypothetical protein
MNLDSLIAKYPSERDAIARLAEVLSSDEHKEYTLNRLSDLVHPNSVESLAGALGELVRSGELKLIVRVISPSTLGGIKDFRSLEEVPHVVRDWRSDTEIEVKPQNLRLVYTT